MTTNIILQINDEGATTDSNVVGITFLLHKNDEIKITMNCSPITGFRKLYNILTPGPN